MLGVENIAEFILIGGAFARNKTTNIFNRFRESNANSML